MSAAHEHAGSAFISSVITGLAVAIPEEVLSYAVKVVSVFFLAMVAEFGRRLINRWFGGKEK